LIGSDAYQLALQAEAIRLKEAQQWEQVSRSTGHASPDAKLMSAISQPKE
jgi:hypothetical protein